MESELVSHLKSLAAAYGVARKHQISTIGKDIAGDWRFFERLDEPKASFTVRKYDEIVRRFSDRWPDGTAWPADVPRPAADVAEEATAA
jgi:hypothetical protein